MFLAETVDQKQVIESFSRATKTVAIKKWRLGAIFLAIALLSAVVFGVYFVGQWDEFLRYGWRVAIGAIDPIYGNDIGYYLFAIPFLNTLQASLVVLFAIGTAIVGLTYLRGFGARDEQEGSATPAGRNLRILLTVNACLLLAAWAWGLYLDRYDLLTDPSGAVFGAGYVDANVTRWLLWVAIGITVAVAGALAWLLLKRRMRLIFPLAGLYVALLFLGLVLVPGAIQRFVVEPNELAREEPYLRHNIALTREAYGLDDIVEIEYRAADTLSLDSIRANERTIDNIRLWDWRPLSETFRQLQQIRTYYAFRDVDVDRYGIAGERRQIMLSARELSYEELPAKTETWVNRRLQYTHGYGFVMSLAAEMTDDGRPILLVKDVPPRGPDDIPITRPEIYYGEGMQGYRIVATGVPEFDYPKGDENAYSRYGGQGGIPLDAIWRQLVFAVYQLDANILISDYIRDGSRIQLWRSVQERVSRIAPFLRLDRDPYLVVSEGKLFWIQDAYTTASRYPYAEPFDGTLNYVRNSVKVVVDAYDGDVVFYVIEPDDPVLKVYRSVFPDLFAPIADMPSDLKRHLRYPQDLFEIQVQKLGTYHIKVPQVFYNREDVWTRPSEKYAGQSITMDPYYILMRLPGEDDLQFLLMTPLTPVQRDNMIAWVAGRSDFPGYGELVVFKLPKEQLVFGPIQVEATIDQDTEISQRLSLWDQRGSQVIRGNLLVIPIDQAFLYVEPVYLQAEGAQIPQLKRVIVSDGRRLAMKPTLDSAIRAVFGDRQNGRQIAEQPQARPRSEDLSAARKAMSAAEATLRELEQQLDRLKELLQAHQPPMDRQEKP